MRTSSTPITRDRNARLVVGRTISVTEVGLGSTSIEVSDVYGNVRYVPVTANETGGENARIRPQDPVVEAVKRTRWKFMPLRPKQLRLHSGPILKPSVATERFYVSGQLPLVGATGSLIDGGIREQTRQLFANISAILDAAGGSLASVLKVTVFIAEWSDFAAFNDVYAELFAPPFRARSTIQNSRPLKALVGADVVAAVLRS